MEGRDLQHIHIQEFNLGKTVANINDYHLISSFFVIMGHFYGWTNGFDVLP